MWCVWGVRRALLIKASREDLRLSYCFLLYKNERQFSEKGLCIKEPCGVGQKYTSSDAATEQGGLQTFKCDLCFGSPTGRGEWLKPILVWVRIPPEVPLDIIHLLSFGL